MKFRRIISILLVTLLVTLVPSVALAYNYTSLGDSIAVGLGADVLTGPNGPYLNGYVIQFAAYMQEKTGENVNVMPLGVSGQDSTGLLQSLRLNTNNIRAKVAQANTITISIGANNLLRALDPTTYSVNQQVAAAGVMRFWMDWPQIIGTVKLLNPRAKIYVTNLYNPFSVSQQFSDQYPMYPFNNLYAASEPYVKLINQPIAYLSAITRDGYTRQNYTVIDTYNGFKGHAEAYIHLLDTNPFKLHPNQPGYDKIAAMHIERF